MSSSSYITVPDSAAYEIRTGCIDFFFLQRGDLSEGTAGLFSYAAGFGNDYGFEIGMGTDDRIYAEFTDGTVSIAECAPVGLARAEWHHLALNFGVGGIELWLDGTQVDGTGVLLVADGRNVDCDNAGDFLGLDNITESIVIGASNWESSAGTTDRVNRHFHGSIDHLRISNTRCFE
jgi:hypothetical protein